MAFRLHDTLSGDEEVSVNGVSYNRQRCCARSLEDGWGSPSGWFKLGLLLSGGERATVNKASYGRYACYWKVGVTLVQWVTLVCVVVGSAVALFSFHGHFNLAGIIQVSRI